MTRPISAIAKYLLHLLKGNRMQTTLNTLAGVALVLLDLAFVAATKVVIDVATHHNSTFSLSEGFMMMGGIMLLRIALTLALRWIRSILGVKARNAMQRHIFKRLLNGDWESLRAYHTGNLTNRMETDVADVVGFVTEDIPSLVTTLVQFVGAFLFLFYMDSTLACVVVLVVPFFLLASKLYMRKMRALTHDIREDESHIQSTIQETLLHAMVVKTLMRTAHFAQRLFTQQQTLHQRVLHRTRYSTISLGITNFGFGLGFLITFIWGAINLEKGAITYGAMLAFIQLVGQIQTPVRTLARFVPVFIKAFTATERLMELDAIPQESESEESVPEGPLGICFDHVSFAYPNGKRHILNDFSFNFPAGKTTAIVGETGAGKTTLIKLTFALIHPQKGSIKLTSSQSIHDITPSLRKHFSYVPQGNTLFSGTIRSNLLLGNPNATEEDMLEVLNLAEATFVKESPNGLDTPCGEAGDGLSEGQAQRIAIARALLSQGRIMVFDEATSALDSETEKRVLNNISLAYPTRTVIFITHRAEVLKHADLTLHINREIE